MPTNGAVWKKRDEKFEVKEGFSELLLALKIEMTICQGMQRASRSWQQHPVMTVKEMEISVKQSTKTITFNNLMSLEKELLKSCKWDSQLMPWVSDSEQRIQLSCARLLIHRDSKIELLCCFKFSLHNMFCSNKKLIQTSYKKLTKEEFASLKGE